MMLAQLDFGAAVDIASGEELKAMGDSVVDRLRPKGKRVIRRPLITSTIMPAAGPALLDFGQVPAGCVWALVHCVITGNDDHTSLSTSSAVTSGFNGAPAAGSDFTITVPAGQTWQLQTLDFSFTTSAAVANRTTQIFIDDGVNVLWKWVSPTVQAAASTVEYNGGVGAVEYAALRNGVQSFELPVITLGPGYRIRSSTLNIQAGDQYTAQRFGYLLSSGSTTTAALYFGGVAPAGNLANNLPILGNLLEPGTPVPAIWRYSKEIITGHDGDGLYALIYGAAAGQNLAGTARVYEWHPDSSEEAMSLP
jgi:hypothetical protein